MANNDHDIKPPRGFNKTKREEFLVEVRQGMRPGTAAEFLGFKRSDVLRFIDLDPDFREQVYYAEQEATELVEEALFQAAISGNVPASRVWLEMRGKMPTGGGGRKANAPASNDPAAPNAPDPFDELDNVVEMPRR